jgi:hypothetical protein
MSSIDLIEVNASTKWRIPPAALAGGVYVALVLLMWGLFNAASGMGYETAFPVISELGPHWWSGFFYVSDPLRIHTNTFYHLSYLLSVVLGIRGSYVPYQIVYALLWWARGFLVFLLLRRFAVVGALIPYVAGALVIVHSSDKALQWIGQMNQFGFIFWMLLAFYFLTLAAGTSDSGTTLKLLVAAWFFEYMSLWSYESQLPLILLYPAVLLFLKPGWRKWRSLTVVWYLAPAKYLLTTVIKYIRAGGGTYQESVMRTTWSVAGLASDWWFNTAASLQFWAWQKEATPNGMAPLRLAIAASGAFIVGGMLLIWTIRRQNEPDSKPETGRLWWTLLAIGSVLLVMSFPVYLLLGDARELWRTQFLSAIGTGLVWTAVLGLISTIMWKKLRRPAIVVLGAVIVYFGASSAIAKSAIHRVLWDRHRAVMVQILNVAPSVRPGTVIVLTGVPKDQDPFGHNMWLDLAVRLCYPGVPVDGVYYYADGTPSPGMNMEAAGQAWRELPTGMPTFLQESTLEKTVVIEWNPSGRARLAKTFPDFICHGPCKSELYNPANVITGPISPVAVNRYHP